MTKSADANWSENLEMCHWRKVSVVVVVLGVVVVVVGVVVVVVGVVVGGGWRGWRSYRFLHIM